MQLNGWQKAGIVLSILWVVGAGIHTRNDDVERTDNFVKFAYKVCEHGKMVANDADLSSCEKEKADNTKTWMKDSDKNVALAALAPIPFGWLAGFILLYAVRVQVAGFKAVVQWSALSRPKKGFAIFCVLTLGAVLLFASMTIMNLYVETEVPVALALKSMVLKTGEDMVRVTGTWTRQGKTAGSAMGYPLQTSTIDCNRQERRCVESRASVAGNLLMSDVVEYDMQSWTKDSIVLKNTGLCVEEVYTIDLNTETVSGAGRRINGDAEYCKMSPTDEERWSYRLADGFPIYWDLRMKARPPALRVLQSFFGH
jgi:hypothetical protein